MLQIPSFGYITGFCHNFLLHATVGMPDSALWVTAGVMFVLAAAAMADAFTEDIPSPLLVVGLMTLIGIQGFYVTWPFAAHHLAVGFGAGLMVWGMNQLLFHMVGDDMFRAGDAKWSVLAAACFGAEPVLCAWGFALAVSIPLVILRRQFNRSVDHLYIAPLLLPGLLGALYVLRVDPHSVGLPPLMLG